MAGVGTGKFKATYNEYQTAYFERHDIDGPEAFLADNTFYAFNDPLQFFAEEGLIGLLLLGCLGVCFAFGIRNAAKHNRLTVLDNAALSSLSVLLTASAFSYPLSILPLVLQGLVCIAILSRHFTIIYSFMLHRYMHVVNLLAGISLLLYAHGLLRYQHELAQAKELSKARLRREALSKYESLSKTIYADGALYYDFAKALYCTKDLQRADSMLTIAMQYFVSNDCYMLSAAIHNEQGMCRQAALAYLRAIRMVPNRIMPRYALMELYRQHGDTQQARYWARSITGMDVKVPSGFTKLIKGKANGYLSGMP